MKLEIFDNKTLIFETTDVKTIINNLMYYTFTKAVNNNKQIKIKYKYNYSDIQTITIVEKSELNKREIVISGIPTKMGTLDAYKILDMLK